MTVLTALFKLVFVLVKYGNLKFMEFSEDYQRWYPADNFMINTDVSWISLSSAFDSDEEEERPETPWIDIEEDGQYLGKEM